MKSAATSAAAATVAAAVLMLCLPLPAPAADQAPGSTPAAPPASPAPAGPLPTAQAPTPTGTAAETLTAEQIAEKCAQARGGLEAWRKVEAVVWKGHLESDRLPTRTVRFELTEKRPNKTRFEILDPAAKSLRVFDGNQGWKQQADQSGMPKVQSLSPMEVRYASEAPGLDGPLVDFALKGRSVTLEGRETIEGRDCYRLSLRLPTGERQTVWVDAQTFLETRYDRTAYGQSGPRGIVSQFFRDYRVVEGLAMPSVIEIGGQGSAKRDRMLIEQVALNPKIPDIEFKRPQGGSRAAEVVIQPPPMPRLPGEQSGPMPAPGSAPR